jgi:CBS domain-containing protein/Flp pilus assembly pilin Flp
MRPHTASAIKEILCMAPFQRPRFVSTLAQCQAANAAVEYAVCLGMVVGAVLVAGVLIGGPLQNAFSTAAAGIQSRADGVQRASGVQTADATSSLSKEEPATRRTLALWLTVALAAAASSFAAVWFVRRRAARSRPAEASEPMPVPKELQAKFVAKRQAILQFLSADTQQLVNGRMAVRHLMSKAPLTKTPDDDVQELRTLMKESVIRHLLVCSAAGELVGIISDRDIQSRDGQEVGDIMTANPITVSPNTSVSTVVTIMLARRISCVPVVEEGRLCGIVTTSDLLMALQCVLRLIEQLALPIDLHPTQAETPSDAKDLDLVACG